MNNFIESGANVSVAAPETADSGEFLIKGALSGVAAFAAASGDPVVLQRKGVFELLKATGAAWSQGDRLYWDASAKNFTVTSAGNQPLGVAFADALSADTVGSVLLDAQAGGFRFAAGQITTVTAADTVVTGLSKVLAVVATLESDPVDNPFMVSAQIGDQAGTPVAGSVVIKTWQNTSGSDPTPAAASTFSKKVNWIAVGI